MIEFDWYIRRARINLDTFFKMKNITSDAELHAYCAEKSLVPPTRKYFEEIVSSTSSPEKANIDVSEKQETVKRNAKAKTETAKTVEKPAPETSEASTKTSPKPRTRTRTKRTTRTKKKTD